MAKCAACKSLVGAKQSSPAHPALKSISQEEYKTFGWHTGNVIRYRCSDCDTKWQLDRDEQDAHAGWTELNE
jgi:DNA-directed RNA polymerase subunit RPC12/RpoP